MAQFGNPDLHFKLNNEPSVLVQKFHFFLEEKRLTDVTLTTAEGESLKAHRLVLASSSQYFEVFHSSFTKFSVDSNQKMFVYRTYLCF